MESARTAAEAPCQLTGIWDTQRRLLHLPPPADVVELLAAPAGVFPEGLAVHLRHHGQPPEDLTYGELWQEARGMAARLEAAGVRRGDRVLLVLPTSRAFIAGFFSILAVGGIPVPASPPFSLKDPALGLQLELLRTLAADARPAACISSGRLLHVLRPSLLDARPELILLAAGTAAPAPQLAIAGNEPGDTALLQYTSGSTSSPKGVELTHRNLLANLASITESLFHYDALTVSWLPLFHDMGLIGTLLTSLWAHAPLVLMPPQAFIKNPALWLHGIAEFRATITAAPNFAFDYCVKRLEPEDLAGVRLDSLRVALNGAEPIDIGAIERFQAKFGQLGLHDGVVLPVYGLAESSLAVTFSEPGGWIIDEVAAERLERDGVAEPAAGSRSWRFVSVGRPVPGQRVRIAGDHGEALPERRVGEILVQGDAVMKGYFGRPRETAAALRDGWLHTGDLGYLAAGRLFVTGRSKDLLIRHGRNYFPQDIEHQVMQIAGVRKGRAAAFAQGAGDEKVVVVAETRLEDPAALARLERAIRERIHQVFLFGPDEVRLLPPGTIPRTTSGKVKRQECRRLFETGELATAVRPSPGFAYRRLLRSLWLSWRLLLRKAPKEDRSSGEREPA